MEIFKIIGIAFITAICSVIIKNTKPELSFAITTAGVLLILLQIFSKSTEIISVFSRISQATKMDNDLLKLILKMVAIGYLTEISSGILIDFGSTSLADKVVLGGKLTILLLSLPILDSLLKILQTFLQVV
jgi:stage III sporulation protein AD